MTSALPTLEQMIADAELRLSSLEGAREQLVSVPHLSDDVVKMKEENKEAIYEAKLWLAELCR